MLKYFYKNKSRYEKGQLAPFFIAILVILITMALVTVNLSKVSLIKTDSSNAVDAGALAAGSAMANLFNAIAASNAQLEKEYWTFYSAISVVFVATFYSLTSAYLSASVALAEAETALALAVPCTCGGVCTGEAPSLAAAAAAAKAIKSLTSVIKKIRALGIKVMACAVAQYYFYLAIREMAEKGHANATEMGHKFTFMNSGIGSKLKPGSPPDDVSDEVRKRNYRDEFSDFLDKEVEDNERYTYDWIDGQERDHYVESMVQIDEVDTFELKVAVSPWAVELLLLRQSRKNAKAAIASLDSAVVAFKAAAASFAEACALSACCCVDEPTCCSAMAAACAAAKASLKTGIAATKAAMASMKPIFLYLSLAWAGLLPGPVITSDDPYDALPFIICWIEDIVHDRKVRVDTIQHHAGKDLGLWQTRYPDVHSYSITDFTGKGQIHPPELRHDASIIETDVISQTETGEGNVEGQDEL